MFSQLTFAAYGNTHVLFILINCAVIHKPKQWQLQHKLGRNLFCCCCFNAGLKGNYFVHFVINLLPNRKVCILSNKHHIRCLRVGRKKSGPLEDTAACVCCLKFYSALGPAAESRDWVPRGNIRIRPNASYKTRHILLEGIYIGNTVPYLGSKKAKHFISSNIRCTFHAESNPFQGINRNLIKENSDSWKYPLLPLSSPFYLMLKQE